MKILWKLLLALIRERNETCNTLPDMLYKQRPARQDNQFLNDGVFKILLKTTIQY